MPQHLRAYLYDPAYRIGYQLAQNIFADWSNGIATAVIPAHFPKRLVESAIVHIDPSEVIDLKDNTSHERKLAVVDTEDLASVVLTSGTTGNPKPVELGFKAMRDSAHALYKKCGLGSDEVWLCCVPPYYVAGLSIFGRVFTNSSRLVFHDNFDVENIRDSINSESITAISLVPFQLQKLFEADVALDHLNAVLIGGGPISPDLISKCNELNIAIHTTYGMSETWGGICIDGDFLDNTQGRITEGEIEISTTSMMLGYRHNYPATMKKFTSDNWFRTGDRGTITDSRLEVLGRADDVIISGGVKIDPVPIENLIRSIFDDVQIAVVATPHTKLGQSSTLCFQANNKPIPQLSKIRALLKDVLPSTHLPTRSATCVKFPRSEVGKLLRNELSNCCEIIEEHISEC